VDQPEKPEAAPAALGTEPVAGTLGDLMQRVNAGDETALARLREILGQGRKAAKYFGGDLAHEAENQLISTLAGANLTMREALRHQAEYLRVELSGGERRTGVERLLIENVVGTWLHLHRLELLYAQQENHSFQTDGFYQKELSAAHKRYLAAIRTLIAARRRPLHRIQFSIDKDSFTKQRDLTPAPTE
jgi:hypothetical protein